MIKLIASDLDGTLLQNGSRTVPPEVIENIKKLTEQGIIFAAASGRQYYNLRNLFKEVQDDIAYICENGALTIYKGEIISKVEVPQDLARRIINRFEAEPETEVLVSGTYTCYIKPKEQLFLDRIHNMGNRYEVVSSWDDIEEPIIKLALFENEGTESRNRQEFWAPKIPSPAKIVTSGAQWLDILLPSMHKGVGMKALQKYLGITYAETMAFGDNLNDVEMFEESGYKVAVENAKPEILEMCPIHTKTVNDILESVSSGSFSEELEG